MVDFANHTDVLTSLDTAQSAEKNNRDKTREAHAFIDDRDGQWEPHLAKNDKKPRYTFDMTNPIVDQVSGEIEQADFGIKVLPSGGEASEDNAAILDGLIRNIQNNSSADKIYASAAKAMVTSGIGGWRVTRKFIDGDSFDQDLIITRIEDFANRVWFDPNAVEQNKSDAEYAHVLQGLTQEAYKEKWPEGSEQSVGDDNFKSTCNVVKDDIIVGQVYWKKRVKRTLVLMTNGAVYEKDEEFAKIQDELAEQEITIKAERNRPKTVVMTRIYDGGGWLQEEEETVFSLIPVVPIYGNYKIESNQTKYRGVVEKLLDPQRVLNYSLSREIEEGALAPRAKWWMTLKQMAGFDKTLATLNTNTDPVQGYNHDPDSPGAPMQSGGAAINPGLSRISESMRGIIGGASGLFAANMGDNPGLQSGVAIKRLQDKGDTSTIGYFTSVEIGVEHTCRILVDGIPKTYDTERQVRNLHEDGSFEMQTLNQVTIDNETGDEVVLNDLSIGTYDVTCSAGPSFQNRQQEAVAGVIEVATVDPSILQIGGDVLLKNMPFPGSDILADRKRAQLFDAGLIPIDQMTDEEKQEMLASIEAKQGSGPTPDQMIGQAELMKAENETKKTDISVAEKSAKIKLEAAKLQLEVQTRKEKARNEQGKLDLDASSTMFEQRLDAQDQRFNQSMELQNQTLDAVVKMSQALKTIQDAAQGPVIGPGFVDNVKEQSDLVGDTQDAAERL